MRGEKFEGRVCDRCGGTTRYAVGGGCVACAKINRESRALRGLPRKAYAYDDTPARVAGTLLNRVRGRCKLGGYETDITRAWLATEIAKAVARGGVSLERNTPARASIDQITPGLGYVMGNIQIVPWWFNAAKHDFQEDAVREAIYAWVAANPQE